MWRKGISREGRIVRLSQDIAHEQRNKPKRLISYNGIRL